MTKNQLIERLQRATRSQADDLVLSDYEDAIDDAEEELGWSMPQTDVFRLKWLRERAIRNLMNFLVTGSARKFRAEGYHLQQRFAHYTNIVVRMDGDFEKAIKEDAHLFANVDAKKMFGFKIDSGFSSNDIGEDTTYSEDNEVIIEPLNG